jgi:hypothetical protein
VGLAVLVWFRIQTGSFFGFFNLEGPWGVSLGTPVEQALYLLCASGTGSFTCQNWQVIGLSLSPSYWLLRNLLFEAFYFVGVLMLVRSRLETKNILSTYSLSVFLPLLFILGVPAMSVPRLLLPAFPIFASFSTLLKRREIEMLYVTLCIIAAGAFSVTYYFAFFS